MARLFGLEMWMVLAIVGNVLLRLCFLLVLRTKELFGIYLSAIGRRGAFAVLQVGGGLVVCV